MTLSIVIPCYNHGLFIQEAIDSVLELRDVEYEIIIINDGSTDAFTIEKLRALQSTGFRVIDQQNSGLAKTRNAGIQAAGGKYILPLDADNKIKPAYVYKAIPFLESGYDIVYARPHFFGSMQAERYYNTRELDIHDLMIVNYIDACAIYKKDVWKQLNGYDAHMPYPGQEDWEFWIHAFTKGFKFRFIDEELFYYRVENNSMISSTNQTDKKFSNQEYIFRKHSAYFRDVLVGLYYISKMREFDMQHPVRTFIKYLYYYLFRRTGKIRPEQPSKH